MGAVIPIILAAGTSSRMGRTKALLPFGEETSLSLVLGACRDGGAAPPVVVLGAQAETIRQHLPAGALVTENAAFRETGPVASLQAGLRQLPAGTTAFLLFPVDFPLVPGTVVAALRQRWDAVRKNGKRIVVPSHDMRRGHPALFDAGLAAEFHRLPADAPMHQVLRSHPAEIEHVPTADPSVLLDMDTPEDYQRCLKLWKERSA